MNINLLNSSCNLQDIHSIEHGYGLKRNATICYGNAQFHNICDNKKITAKKSNRRHHKRNVFTKSKDLEQSSSRNTTLWIPPLHVIYNDKLLLDALTAHMTKSYNEENILFLKSVDELKNTIDADIDSKIISIYTLYINPNSEYQINLSSDCFCDLFSKRNTFTTFNNNQKLFMFDSSIIEIEKLIISSILPSFYRSALFQNISSRSKHCESYNIKQERKQSKTKNNMHMVTNKGPKIRSFTHRSSNHVDKYNLPRIQLPDIDKSAYGRRLAPPRRDSSWNTPAPTKSEIKIYKNRARHNILCSSSVAYESPLSASSTSSSSPVLSHSATDISADCGCAEEPNRKADTVTLRFHT